MDYIIQQFDLEKPNLYIINKFGKNINSKNDENISKNSDEFINYQNEGKIKLRDQMYSSYDFFLSNKYKVNINQKTLERVKNYFK